MSRLETLLSRLLLFCLLSLMPSLLFAKDCADTLAPQHPWVPFGTKLFAGDFSIGLQADPAGNGYRFEAGNGTSSLVFTERSIEGLYFSSLRTEPASLQWDHSSSELIVFLAQLYSNTLAASFKKTHAVDFFSPLGPQLKFGFNVTGSANTILESGDSQNPKVYFVSDFLGNLRFALLALPEQQIVQIVLPTANPFVFFENETQSTDTLVLTLKVYPEYVELVDARGLSSNAPMQAQLALQIREHKETVNRGRLARVEAESGQRVLSEAARNLFFSGLPGLKPSLDGLSSSDTNALRAAVLGTILGIPTGVVGSFLIQNGLWDACSAISGGFVGAGLGQVLAVLVLGGFRYCKKLVRFVRTQFTVQHDIKIKQLDLEREISRVQRHEDRFLGLFQAIDETNFRGFGGELLTETQRLDSAIQGGEFREYLEKRFTEISPMLYKAICWLFLRAEQLGLNQSQRDYLLMLLGSSQINVSYFDAFLYLKAFEEKIIGVPFRELPQFIFAPTQN